LTSAKHLAFSSNHSADVNKLHRYHREPQQNNNLCNHTR